MKKIILFAGILFIIAVTVYLGRADIFTENIFNPGVTEKPEQIGAPLEKGEPHLTEENLRCKDCNLVIISLTNTRKDHLGIYGYKRNTSPNIDRFFADSLVFENYITPASWTLPVAASFFTSLFPYQHKVMERLPGTKFEGNISTLAEVFQKNGYKTAGFTGGGDYNRTYNFTRGFDFYLDEQNYAQFGVSKDESLASERQSVLQSAYLSVEKLFPQAGKWLEKNSDEKFFIFLQGFDTHCPFTPKAPFKNMFDSSYQGDVDFSVCLWTFDRTKPVVENGQKFWKVKTSVVVGPDSPDVKISERDVERMVALYDGEIAQADNALKIFFEKIKELGLEENTIFIFMSEHGDLFGEHEGRFMRGGPLRGTFYDAVINPPLLIKHPKIKGLVKIKTLAQAVDIAPTLFDIFGLSDPSEAGRQGRSLTKTITGKEAGNDYAYAASRFTAFGSIFFQGISSVEVVREQEWKLIKEEIFNKDTGQKAVESYELYNLVSDPGETENLVQSRQDKLEELKAKLEEKINEWK